MNTIIKVSEQRLNTLLIIVLAYAYIRVYWAVMSAISNTLSSTIFSIIAIAVMVLSVVPVVHFLKEAVLKLLTQE